MPNNKYNNDFPDTKNQKNSKASQSEKKAETTADPLPKGFMDKARAKAEHSHKTPIRSAKAQVDMVKEKENENKPKKELTTKDTGKHQTKKGLELMPEPFNGIQVNGCDNWLCDNWGALSKDHKSDTGIWYGYYAGNKDQKGQTVLAGRCQCGYGDDKANEPEVEEEEQEEEQEENKKGALTKFDSWSNKAIQKAIDATSTETVFNKETSCKNETCENHGKSIYTHNHLYTHNGYITTKKAKKSLWECKSCGKGNVFETTGNEGSDKQRTDQTVDEFIFRGFIKGLGFRPMEEVFGMNHSTIRRRIDAYNAQAMRWIEHYAQKIKEMDLRNPRLETDGQSIYTNWRDNDTTNKQLREADLSYADYKNLKRGIEIERIGTAEGRSGYILELTHNFDITVDTLEAALIIAREKANRTTKEQDEHAHWKDVEMPFFADQLWQSPYERIEDVPYEVLKEWIASADLKSDDLKEGEQQVEMAVAKKKNGQHIWESTRGTLITKRYSAMAHWHKVKRLMSKTSHYHYAIDHDTELTSSVVRAHFNEIKEKRVNLYSISGHIQKRSDFKKDDFLDVRKSQGEFTASWSQHLLKKQGFEAARDEISSIAQRTNGWETKEVKDYISVWLTDARMEILKSWGIDFEKNTNKEIYTAISNEVYKAKQDLALEAIIPKLKEELEKLENPKTVKKDKGWIPIPNPSVKGLAKTIQPLTLIDYSEEDQTALMSAAKEIDNSSTHALDNFFMLARQNQFTQRKRQQRKNSGILQQIKWDDEDQKQEIEMHIWDPYKSYDPQTLIKAADIQRFYYNFIKATRRPYELEAKTPAMRLGIIDHPVSFDEFMNKPFYTIGEGYRDKKDKTEYKEGKAGQRRNEKLRAKEKPERVIPDLPAKEKAEYNFIARSAYETIWGTEKALKRMKQKHDYEMKRKKKYKEQSKNK